MWRCDGGLSPQKPVPRQPVSFLKSQREEKLKKKREVIMTTTTMEGLFLYRIINGNVTKKTKKNKTILQNFTCVIINWLLRQCIIHQRSTRTNRDLWMEWNFCLYTILIGGNDSLDHIAEKSRGLANLSEYDMDITCVGVMFSGAKQWPEGLLKCSSDSLCSSPVLT